MILMAIIFCFTAGSFPGGFSFGKNLDAAVYSILQGAMEYVQEKAFILFSLSLSFVTCDERCRLRDGQSYLNRLEAGGC